MPGDKIFTFNPRIGARASASAILILLLIAGSATAANAADAKVSFLEGTARSGSSLAGPWQTVYKNSKVRGGYYVKTGTNSRMELTFPDGSLVRLAANTTLQLKQVQYNPQNQTRWIQLKLEAGRLWNRISQSLSTSQRDYTVQSGSAVAGVRGTTFNVELFSDSATRVSVFKGEVWVTNYTDYLKYSRQHPEAFKIPERGFTKPKQVPGPRLATRDEWMAVVSSQRQVRISSQGAVNAPEPLEPAVRDDNWTEWNEERDSEAPDTNAQQQDQNTAPTLIPIEPAPTPEPAPAEPAPEPTAVPAEPEPTKAEPAPAPEPTVASEPASASEPKSDSDADSEADDSASNGEADSAPDPSPDTDEEAP